MVLDLGIGSELHRENQIVKRFVRFSAATPAVFVAGGGWFGTASNADDAGLGRCGRQVCGLAMRRSNKAHASSHYEKSRNDFCRANHDGKSRNEARLTKSASLSGSNLGAVAARRSDWTCMPPEKSGIMFAHGLRGRRAFLISSGRQDESACGGRRKKKLIGYARILRRICS